MRASDVETWRENDKFINEMKWVSFWWVDV
jgi:hypothetical protein